MLFFWLFWIRIQEDPGLFAFAATVLWVLQEARLAGVGILSGLNVTSHSLSSWQLWGEREQVALMSKLRPGEVK